MQDQPTVRHSHVQINGSFVHLARYAAEGDAAAANLTLRTNMSAAGDSSFSTRTASSIWSQSSPERRATSDASKLIVFVPGNPGILGVYHDFLGALFRAVNGSLQPGDAKTSILAIGHNNFDHLDSADYKSEARICIEESELNFVERSIADNHRRDPHSVELQVLNKLIILKRLLNLDKCKIVFVAHSIGCYVVLRLLQDRALTGAHLGSVLVHPALENMAITPKGARISRLFGYKLDLVAHALAFALDRLLPKAAKLALVRWSCSPEFVAGSSAEVVHSVGQLINWRSLTALIDMAKSEFALVKGLNAEAMIKPHATKLKLIYAIDDHWVNSDHRRTLGRLYPELHIEEQATLHAFMMDPEAARNYAIKVGLYVGEMFKAPGASPGG